MSRETIRDDEYADRLALADQFTAGLAAGANLAIPDSASCEHAVVLAFRFDEPTHETFGRIALWACQRCRLRFEPVTSAAARVTP